MTNKRKNRFPSSSGKRFFLFLYIVFLFLLKNLKQFILAVYFFHVSIMLFSDYQECVSVRPELVTLVKSHLVGVHNLLIATESGNGHQHRGFRKMKV